MSWRKLSIVTVGHRSIGGLPGFVYSCGKAEGREDDKDEEGKKEG